MDENGPDSRNGPLTVNNLGPPKSCPLSKVSLPAGPVSFEEPLKVIICRSISIVIATKSGKLKSGMFSRVKPVLPYSWSLGSQFASTG